MQSKNDEKNLKRWDQSDFFLFFLLNIKLLRMLVFVIHFTVGNLASLVWAD